MSAFANRTHSAHWLAATCLCLTLTGCGVYNSSAGGGFSTSSLTAAGSGAGIPFQVDGKVGGIQGAPLAAAVGGAMPTSVAGATVHYAACEPYTECAGDHLVWTFGPPDARPASSHPPALGTNLNWFGSYEPAANNVTVKLALFQGGNVVASVSGQTDADSPNDPAFQALIAGMSQSVLSGPDIFDEIGLP
jgi:hypothetical protein